MLGLALLCGCVMLDRRPPRGADPQTALQAVLLPWSPATLDSVTVAGFRQADGKRTPETDVLDELLLSAALRAGVAVRPDAGVAGMAAGSLPWGAEAPLPRDWRSLPGLVVAGQVRSATPWAYLRLVLADARTGQLRGEGRTRIAERDLASLVAERQQRLAVSATRLEEEIDIELHVVVRRDDGGFLRRVDLQEGGQLAQGDQLQLRYRASQDCEVYAFLYRSDGTRDELVGGGTIYANRWIYAPGENLWHSLSAGDEVYTLYVLVAPRIEEDRGTLWQDLAELQSTGRVEGFRGLDLVDVAVVRLLQRTATGADSLQVLRGTDGIEAGEMRSFVYSDGTTFDSRGDLLRGYAIARAYSAEVLYR